jgi:hypothetical protein
VTISGEDKTKNKNKKTAKQNKKQHKKQNKEYAPCAVCWSVLGRGK